MIKGYELKDTKSHTKSISKYHKKLYFEKNKQNTLVKVYVFFQHLLKSYDVKS